MAFCVQPHRSAPACTTTQNSGPLCSITVTKIPVRRFTARVLPIDRENRVLLLHGFDPAVPDRPFWFTIGGALEGSETPQEAAARELYEEVGIRAGVGEITGPHGSRITSFDFAQYAITQDETFLAVRVDGEAAVSFDHMEQVEKETTLSYRWWSADELDATGETVHPENLGELLRKIVQGFQRR
ncbi:NUDIX domain-containing protein [Nonomuraea terrae]|uniref:NUDIX domain-containing protein n=1 Tax=Nonomuraea terrae TaxID=2530383 RepID=A0A4R4XKK7_9ACTN|nr:NUDIX domain-containing protein [Nonomuraea terrae]